MARFDEWLDAYDIAYWALPARSDAIGHQKIVIDKRVSAGAQFCVESRQGTQNIPPVQRLPEAVSAADRRARRVARQLGA